MHSEFDARGAAGTARAHHDEPVAIVGIAALYPGVQGADSYWRHLTEPLPPPGAAAPSLADIEVDVAQFGIPPAQAGALTRMQLLMLEAARECLEDAKAGDRTLQAERTDVVAGVCAGLDRQYANALRVEGSRYARELERALTAPEFGGSARTAAQAADELRTALVRRLGASPHDRVGEMASTIPARIASAFKLRGRTLALESADATSFLALAHALDSLRGGLSEAVLVVTGQREEGPFLRAALAAKGLVADRTRPFAADGCGFALGEGVGALLLKRLSSAVRDGDRVYATVRGCAVRHEGRPGVFRYSTSVERRAGTARAALDACGAAPASVGYVECGGYGVAHETRAELAALKAVYAGAGAGSVVVGSVRDRLGHTFANAGLASVTKAALALYHRRLPPGLAPAPGPPFRTLPEPRKWHQEAGAGPRRATVSGASLTGTLCHLVLEEHDPDTAAAAAERPRTTRVSVAPEPIAIVGYGGRFGDAPDADAFWAAMLTSESRIGPLPESLLDRELYYEPGKLSLTRSYTDQGSPLEVPAAPPEGLRIPPRRWAAMDAAQRVALSVAGELMARRGPAAPALRGPGLVATGTNLSLSRERRAAAGLALGEVESAVGGLAALGRLDATETATLLDLVRERYAAGPAPRAPEDLDGCLAGGVAAVIAGEYGLDAVPLGIEAACASSLAALDVAVGRLRSGSVDYALAGGVELPCNARDMVLCSALGLLSHGRITPFDTAADGFTPGDGCALFLLKRYADARRDGDAIHGLLCGIGASNDAKSLIAPDADGQVRAMRQAFGQAGFEPADVGYLEAHGTGTRVGDRVEIAAVARVYASPHRRRPLEIGSAKSFFGHTFAAAGAAGLLRALHALRTGVLPANAGLTTVSPELDLDRVPARVSTGTGPWVSAPGRPRRAGVSSFGTGGINYHVLIEEHLDGPR
ncbi:polyketide synthase [Streptomyces roseoverticillatus]|uniref:beta-ketoacyl [acyl carrier protein] synthase domain-containing protein n=1 Tax=Streptomyces roseoverticillatus TaxID=66429 RepID=UPI000998604B|nr:polyketide synthase [Streptomyces roseoverticillatus]